MTVSSFDYAVFCTALVAAWIWLRRKQPTSSGVPLPPGPPSWPLIGSVLSLPQNEPNWKAFIRWGEEIKSDVIYAPMPGNNLVILNSHEAAIELLEHRSAVYSYRPRLVMAGELAGWDQNLGLMSDTNRVRRVRKLLHDGMNNKAMQNWRPMQEQEALRFVQRLLRTPEDLVAHIRQTAAATVVKLTYGYTVHDTSDEYIMAAEQAMDSFSHLSAPGAYLVDIFPWLQYIPWAPFKKVAADARKRLNKLEDMPMGFVRQQMEAGGEHSLVSGWLENPKQEADYEDVVKVSAASLYAGGADTTVSAISTFFIAMLYNPAAQATAQAEIERVIGTGRLPTYADRESLPYVEAVYKEVLRWQPLVPLGLPHKYMASSDDSYKGMRIPTNTAIIANIWAILRDSLTYKDPDTFNPDRHLGVEPQPNPEDVAFGFGRRRCPGINVAQSSVWLSIALTLAAYDITPVVDEDGKPKLPSLQYSNTTVSHPPPFECKITPRSDKITKIIEEALM